MGIPYRFDPLGTLGASERRPFPMVRFWQEVEGGPVYGGTVDGGPLPEGFNVGPQSNAWKAFDGDLGKNVSQFRTGSFWMVDFGRKVELKALRVYWGGAGIGNTLELQYEKDGEWLSAGVEYDHDSGTRWYDSGEISINAQRFRLYKNNGDNAANLYEVEYTAFYES